MTSSHEKYKLSAERHEAVYRIIERFSFLDTTPKEYPQAIIIGGQPGAGKSRLLDYSFNEIPGHNRNLKGPLGLRSTTCHPEEFVVRGGYQPVKYAGVALVEVLDAAKFGYEALAIEFNLEPLVPVHAPMGRWPSRLKLHALNIQVERMGLSPATHTKGFHLRNGQ